MPLNFKKHTLRVLILMAQLVIIIVLVLLISLRPTPKNVSAHSGDIFGPACGMAIVDGQVNALEWTTAASQTFQMIVPGAGTPFTGTLSVMNGAYYLYYALTINDNELSSSATYLPKGDTVSIVFDNDHSGTLFHVNDDILSISAGTPHFEDHYIVGTPVPTSNHNDTLGGGASNGAGAVQRITGLNHFEGKHPLCSGDTLDFCLHPGDTVGFRIEYLDAEADGSFGGSQLFPGQSSTDEADIVIGDCAIPDIFTFLPLIEH